MTSRLVFNLPQRFLDGFANGRPPVLYSRIREVAEPWGAEVVLDGPLRPGQLRRLKGDAVHIVEAGRFRHPSVLNAGTAYLDGFFHLDPVGMQAASGIGLRPYDPQSVDPVAAAAYHERLRQRFVVPRLSRYRQMRALTEVPTGAIAVFLQGPAPQDLGQALCSYEDMVVRVCEGAGGRPVVVKPHPLSPEVGQATIARVQARGHKLTQTAGNVHDILATCALTVSVNSGASVEGFLHGRPAVFFGTSDCHHFAETVSDHPDFAAAARVALTRPRDYARAMYWYFGLQCLEAASSGFEARLREILTEAGFQAGQA